MITEIKKLSPVGVYARFNERLWRYVLKVAGAQLERGIRLESRSITTSQAALRLLHENKRFRHLHRGRRAFIIGNGPSLSCEDLSTLGMEVTFAASGFWRHAQAAAVNPKYYTFADPLFFNGDAALQPFFDGFRRAGLTSQIFVPYDAHSYVAEKQPFGELPVNYVAFTKHMRSLEHIPPDMALGLAHVINVVHMQIMIAMYMGCSRICLLGVDHDWLSHRGEDRHFYRERTIQNHALAKPSLAQRPYKEWMEIMLKLWNDYETLRCCAKREGVEIVNCTAGGFLDLFERKSLRDELANRS